MNDDDFEKKLQALTRALRRPDPTAAWKADILSQARREAGASPHVRTLPPRWLMLSWAAAWIAIVALEFTSPQFSDSDATLNQPPMAQTPLNTKSAKADLPALIAFHSHLNLNLDLP